jgi:hypothetical protein
MKRKLLALSGVLLLSAGSAFAQVFPAQFEDDWTPLNPSSQWGTAGPMGWMIGNIGDNNAGWRQTIPGVATEPPHSGTYAAYLEADTDAAGGAVSSDWLITPTVIGITSISQLHFYSRLGSPGDQGGTYKLMVTTGAQDVYNLYTVVQEWTETQINPEQGQYVQKIVNLPANLAGQMVHFAFVREGVTGDSWLIDDITLTEVCSPPQNLAVTNATETSLTLGWTGNSISFEVLIVPADAVPNLENVVVINTTDNEYEFTGLLPSVEYKIYVRALCPDGGLSEWVSYTTQTNFANPVTGILRYDSNGDGICNEQDNVLPNKEINVTLNGDSFSVYTNAEGEYAFGTNGGTNTVALQVAPLAGFTNIAPVTQTVTFDEETTTQQIDLCLPTPEAVTDLAVQLVPLDNAVPGFDAHYHLILNNNGSVPVNGAMVTVLFNDDRLNFVTADPAFTVNGNILTYTFNSAAYSSSLLATLTFEVEQPPVNIGDDTLVFTAALTGVANESTPDDNAVAISQVIVNSWDPNDILVREGSLINTAQVGDYLNYTIRFQNTGTADATNVRVENLLGDKLDWDTFELTGGSHDFFATRNGGTVEFKFNSIHLAAESADEVASHGYVSYRIKPKSDVGLGDIMTNDANIFFDFNPAVATNTATTEVEGVMGLNYNIPVGVKLYPNPVKNTLHVGLKDQQLQSVVVYDINGRQCLTSATAEINLQTLQPGMYFVKVTTDKGISNYKIVKE